VTRGFFKKDSTMRSKLVLFALGTALAGCTAGMPDDPNRGLATTKVPVVTSANYVFDASAPGGSLASGEADRLNGWFQGLGLGYGDSVYVDGAYGGPAAAQVAQVAGRYGLLVQPGAPVTAGGVAPGSVRVVVSRRRAEVPGCPDWSIQAQPNYSNANASNWGCAVNSNLAAMVADPVDLIHGREAGSVTDATTATRAVDLYRKQTPTGSKPLQSINTKGN
jgi:pilus assembly protein CpaD